MKVNFIVSVRFVVEQIDVANIVVDKQDWVSAGIPAAAIVACLGVVNSANREFPTLHPPHLDNLSNLFQGRT